MPKSEWTEEAVLQLIELWKQEDCLHEYRDKSSRARAINNITKKLKPLLPNATYHGVRSKMQNLRGHYTRLLSKVLYSTYYNNGKKGKIYKPQVFWYEKMSFLRNFVCNGRHAKKHRNHEKSKHVGPVASEQKEIKLVTTTNGIKYNVNPMFIITTVPLHPNEEKIQYVSESQLPTPEKANAQCVLTPESPIKVEMEPHTTQAPTSPVPIPLAAPEECKFQNNSVDLFDDYLEDLPSGWEEELEAEKMMLNFRSSSVGLSESSLKLDEPMANDMVTDTREAAFCKYIHTELTQLKNESIKSTLMENITSLVISAKKNDKSF